MRSASLKFQPRRAGAKALHSEIAADRFRTSLTLAAMSLGYGVVQLDVTIVNTALNSIGALARRRRRPSCNGSSAPTPSRLPPSSSPPARSATASAPSGSSWPALRSSPLRRLACALAPNALDPDRGARGPGAGSGDPGAEFARAPQPCLYRRKARGRAVGIWAAGASLALTAGPLVGGGLIALVGWRSIFLVNLPIGLAGLWLTLALCQRDHAIAAARDRSARPDRGDRGARLPCRRDHRRRRARVGAIPFVIAGFVAAAHPRRPVRLAGTARAAADAAAVAVSASDVRVDLAGRPSRQRRVLRADLRAQPVFPAASTGCRRSRPGLPSSR